MPELAVTVYVHDELGEVHRFTPEDSVPVWAQKRITNPDAWATAPSMSGSTQAAEAAPEPTTGSGDSGAPDVTVVPPNDPGSASPPPKGGRGSGLGPWIAYADSIGVSVAEGATKDEVIAAVEAASK